MASPNNAPSDGLSCAAPPWSPRHPAPLGTPAQARDAAGRLPAGAVVVLPGGGHVGPLLHAAPQLVDTVTAAWSDRAAFVTSTATSM